MLTRLMSIAKVSDEYKEITAILHIPFQEGVPQ